MFNIRKFVLVLCLASGLCSAVLAPLLSAQTVELIIGTGFTPNTLEVGTRVAGNTLVTADEDTIVVLSRRWEIETNRVSGGIVVTTGCEEWVILRGRDYSVPGSNGGTCRERGNGGELGRAVGSNSMLGYFTVLTYSSPNADDRDPENLATLKRELYQLRQQIEDQPPPAETSPRLRTRPSLQDTQPSRVAPTRNPGTIRIPPGRGVVTPRTGVTRGQFHAETQQDKCLHRKENNWNNGNPIHIWDCNAGAASMSNWEYVAASGYIRSSSNRNMCWHKQFNHFNNGNPIHLWNCAAGGAANKAWTYEPRTGLIRSRSNPSKCIHKRDGGFSNGNPIHLWDCSQGTRQFMNWQLR